MIEAIAVAAVLFAVWTSVRRLVAAPMTRSAGRPDDRAGMRRRPWHSSSTPLSKRYGAVQALDGVSFVAQPGQVFGFLGPNGAGKTTTMRIVLDIIHADAGSVTWAGGPPPTRRAEPGDTSPRSAASIRG